MKLIAVILAIVCISSLVAYGVGSVKAAAPDKWLTRAKDAGNPSQVAEFLGKYKDGLIEDGRVDGKYTSIWRYEATKMTVYVRAIEGLQQRALALAQQDATQQSYQMGLINLEKDLGDIEPASEQVWNVDVGYPLIFVASAFCVMAVIAGAKAWGE